MTTLHFAPSRSSIKDFETKGYNQFGARMGRRSTLSLKTEAKLSLVLVRLDSGGYDKGGAYWGEGQNPLYCASDENTEVYYLRAASRAEAKAQFPNARFFR